MSSVICLEYGELLEKNSLGSPLPFFRRVSTTLRVRRVMVKGQDTAAVFHNPPRVTFLIVFKIVLQRVPRKL